MSFTDLFKRKEHGNPVGSTGEPSGAEEKSVSAAVAIEEAGPEHPESAVSENEDREDTNPEETRSFLRLRTTKANDIKPLFSYYQRCADDARANFPSLGIGLLYEELLKQVLVPEWDRYIDSGELDAFVTHICGQAAELLKNDAVDFPMVYSMVPQDALAAFICVLPATNPDVAVTQEQIQIILTRKDVHSSSFLTEDIASVVREKKYFQIFAAAKGKPPVHGENGKVIDHYPREWNPPAWTGEDDEQGIKSLKFVTPIKKGDVICEIVPPTTGTVGSNIYGKLVMPVSGKPAGIPGGRNTELSEDRLLLLSSADGHIIYEHHEFHVNHTLSIPGSLDGSVGKYNFLGNIEVNGNVAQGVKLSAEGDIKVFGTVEGATLAAKGHITLKNGMNGNFSGLIRTGQYVKSRFLENTTIRADQDVLTESIINCDVASGVQVEVTRGNGTIMGGTIYALKSVSAKMIGKPSGIVTEIYLGSLPVMDSEELTKLQEQREEMQSVLDNLNRNLERFKKNGAAVKSKEMFDQLCVQANLYSTKIAELDQRIKDIQNPKVALEECFVQANLIYPNTRIHIGSSTYQVDQIEHSCRFYYSTDDREIIRGSMF